MALTSYTVENYRAFAKPTTIELRPLTLLFGYNSAGKSALLRALPLLAASVEPGNAGPIALRSPAARAATFAELRSRWTSHLFVRFGLTWDDADSPVRKAQLSLLDLTQARRQVVESIRTWNHHEQPLLDLRWTLPEDELGGLPPTYDVLAPNNVTAPLPMTFAGLQPHLADESLPGVPDEEAAALRDSLHALRVRLASLQSSIHWLGSIRSLPPRRSTYTSPVRRLQPDGEGAAEVLAYDALEEGAVLREVAAWYQQATNHRIEVQREASGLSEQFYISLSPLQGAPVPIHLVDTGEGMAQVLPVIVLGAMARHGKLGRDPVIAIEQPELHLHPRAHAEVAAFCAQLASSDTPPRLLIEAHSENFLLRIQLAIVRGELSPDNVLVYWVRQMDDGQGAVERITFDELGRPEGDNWPPGVFSEDIEQSRTIAIERRKRRQG